MQIILVLSRRLLGVGFLFALFACAQTPVVPVASDPSPAAQASLSGTAERCPAGGSLCRQTLADPAMPTTPIDLFTLQLGIIRTSVAELGQDKLLEALTNEKSRTALLQFQGICKIYERSDLSGKDRERVIATRDEIKELEGEVGEVMRHSELLERSQGGGASEKTVKQIQQGIAKSKKSFTSRLKALGWFEKPLKKIQQLVDRLGKIEFKGRRANQREQVKSILETVKETRKKLATIGPYFESRRFSEDELENGLHTMRRSLRWITTMLKSATGTFVLSEQATSNIAGVGPKYETSKYIQFATPAPDAVTIDRAAALLVAKLVADLGELKDFKESQLDLAPVLIASGEITRKSDAEVRAGQIMTQFFGPTDVEAQSRALYQLYFEQDPLAVLQRDLEQSLLR